MATDEEIRKVISEYDAVKKQERKKQDMKDFLLLSIIVSGMIIAILVLGTSTAIDVANQKTNMIHVMLSHLTCSELKSVILVENKAGLKTETFDQLTDIRNEISARC